MSRPRFRSIAPALPPAFADWSRRPASRGSALGICLLGLCIRLLIARNSIGSNDIVLWERFARLVKHFGVLQVYAIEAWFNHPPLMGLYSEQALDLADRLNLPFGIVFKVVPILASTLTIWLVYRIGRLNVFWLLLYACNPIDVLISAYHGNTDALVVMFSIASVWLADQNRVFLGGLALGAAMNVKLIPTVLIVPMVLSIPPRQIWRFMLGLGLCVLPYVPVYMYAWDGFRHNAIEYNSFWAPWGIGLIKDMLTGRLAEYAPPFASFAMGAGKTLILFSSAVIGVIQLVFRPWTRAELCGIAFAGFLAITPGFGVQYMIYPAAFLAAVSGYRRSFQFLYVGGIFVFFVYLGYWTGTYPAFSNFDRPYELRTLVFGCLAWLSLCRFLVYMGERGLRRIAEYLREGYSRGFGVL
jgi:hypothetical protein